MKVNFMMEIWKEVEYLNLKMGIYTKVNGGMIKVMEKEPIVLRMVPNMLVNFKMVKGMAKALLPILMEKSM